MRPILLCSTCVKKGRLCDTLIDCHGDEVCIGIYPIAGRGEPFDMHMYINLCSASIL
jgi:hypothetical protein